MKCPSVPPARLTVSSTGLAQKFHWRLAAAKRNQQAAEVGNAVELIEPVRQPGPEDRAALAVRPADDARQIRLDFGIAKLRRPEPLRRQRPGDAYALALTAREGVRIAIHYCRVETDDPQQRRHPVVEFGTARQPVHIARVADDLLDRHARIERREGSWKISRTSEWNFRSSGLVIAATSTCPPSLRR
jgi:hypothetical protein